MTGIYRVLLAFTALVLCLFSAEAQPFQKQAWSHYDECARETSSFRAMVACGKAKRAAYCRTASNCGSNGQALEDYADSLSRSVADGSMGEEAARRRWIEFKATMQARAAAARPAPSGADLPVICTPMGASVICN